MENMNKNIYQRIIELADVNLQRKLWLNEDNESGLISSYNELLCSLFDDFNFDYFIDNSASKILTHSTIVELNKLRELLNAYEEKDSDEEIIKDPEWMKIVEQANVVLREWDKS